MPAPASDCSYVEVEQETAGVTIKHPVQHPISTPPVSKTGILETEQLNRGATLGKHRANSAGTLVPERRHGYLPTASTQKGATRRHQLGASEGKERVRTVSQPYRYLHRKNVELAKSVRVVMPTNVKCESHSGMQSPTRLFERSGAPRLDHGVECVDFVKMVVDVDEDNRSRIASCKPSEGAATNDTTSFKAGARL